MRIGALNTPLLVQEQNVVPDGEGGFVAQWSTIAAGWGNVKAVLRDITASETSTYSHIVTMRSRSDITFSPSLRLASETKFYQIRHVVEAMPYDGFVELYVTEINTLN